MAQVVINSFLFELLNTSENMDFALNTEFTIEATCVRDVIKSLEQQFPQVEDKLRSRIAVAIDGEIFSDPLLEELEEDSEVYFLPAIEGG